MAQPSSNDSSETTTTSSNSNVSSATGEENRVIKIKQERIDPEIENKIHLLKNNIKIEPPDDDTHETNGHTKNQYKESEDEEEDSNDSDSSEQDPENEGDEEEEDEKKNIEPVKSSNEILAELFKVFNAAPPEELLDDKNLIKKAKKHRKEKKKKRKKTKGEDSVTDSEDDEMGSGEKHKHKKSKKKHKHKHKEGSKEKTKEKDKHKEKSKKKDRDKERAKSKDKDKERSKRDKKSSERGRSRDRAKSREKDKKLCESGERKRHHEKEDRTESISKRRKTEDKESKTNTFYNGFTERENSKETNENEKVKIKTELKERKSRRDSEDGHISEISLSDEETYLKEKESHGDYSKRKVHNSFYDSSRDKERHQQKRDYSREHYRDRERDRKRDGSYKSRGSSKRYYSRYSRSRSRTRSRSRDLGIDKKRLLEIARKNAISMFKRGNLPGCDNMSQEIKDKVLLKMRYGGRTVEDLTEFCKKISNGENLSDLSSDEDSDVDKVGNTKAFHHPFQLKEREPIVMHIRNSKPIVPVVTKTEEQTKAITMQFPVSSGQQHRLTEHWTPVENKDNLPSLPALPTAAQSTVLFKNVTLKNALGKPLPIAEEQEPAFKSVPVIHAEAMHEIPAPPPTEVVPVVPAVIPTPVLPTIPITVPPPPLPNYARALSTAITPAPAAMEPAATPTFIPDVPVPSTNSSVFPQTNNSVFPQTNCSNLDVSSIISKRLNAMRRLQENPLDSEAIKMMYNSQKEMSTWASSKHLPGQFTGSTGVNILKPNELNSGPQIWARRDQLTSSKPVTGGMGMHLLQKMGWKPGEGLGREKNGSLQPLLLDVKLDKRGLVAQEDCHRKGMQVKKKGGGGIQNTQMAQQNIEGKHPVCLLNELTSKRKWTPPLYTLVNENGPSHSKMFLFSVQVNGQTFTPNKACNTKKEAKMMAAKNCLEEIGILPKC